MAYAVSDDKAARYGAVMIPVFRKVFATMNEQHTSAIFGMNFLQEMKGETVEIIGEYDPEQQLWVVEGQVQAGGSNVYNPRSYTTFQTSRGSTNISFQTNHPDGGSTVDHSTQQDYKPDMNFYR